MKYLDTENAELEIEIYSIKKLRNFLKNHLNEINKFNFKRVTIDIKYININEAIKIINDLITFEKCNFLLMIKTKLKCIPIENFSNLLIINTSSITFNNDNIYKEGDVYKTLLRIINFQQLKAFATNRFCIIMLIQILLF